MASVLYDLHMICWLFVWRKSEEVRSGVGVVKNPEPGVILAERKGCLFSPVRGKIWWLFGENTLQQRKRHSMLKSDASFCLSRKVFPDEISPRLHLLETLRVGQNRYIRQMFESNATRHYNPQW